MRTMVTTQQDSDLSPIVRARSAARAAGWTKSVVPGPHGLEVGVWSFAGSVLLAEDYDRGWINSLGQVHKSEVEAIEAVLGLAGSTEHPTDNLGPDARLPGA